MQLLLRTSALVFILGLLTVGIFGLRYACSPREMLMVIRCGENLEYLHETVLHRHQDQYQAVQEWMTQYGTWEETMQRLQELDREMDEVWPGYTSTVGETTQLSAKERHYQLIFHYVQTVLHERPEELTVVLRRLEKDSQQLRLGSSKLGNAARDAGARKGGRADTSSSP